MRHCWANATIRNPLIDASPPASDASASGRPAVARPSADEDGEQHQRVADQRVRQHAGPEQQEAREAERELLVQPEAEQQQRGAEVKQAAPGPEALGRIAAQVVPQIGPRPVRRPAPAVRDRRRLRERVAGRREAVPPERDQAQRREDDGQHRPGIRPGSQQRPPAGVAQRPRQREHDEHDAVGAHPRQQRRRDAGPQVAPPPQRQHGGGEQEQERALGVDRREHEALRRAAEQQDRRQSRLAGQPQLARRTRGSGTAPGRTIPSTAGCPRSPARAVSSPPSRGSAADRPGRRRTWSPRAGPRVTTCRSPTRRSADTIRRPSGRGSTAGRASAAGLRGWRRTARRRR